MKASQPGADDVGSSTMAQEPPGIALEGAAGQDDQGVNGNVERAGSVGTISCAETVIDEAQSAKFAHVVSAKMAGPNGGDFGSDGDSGKQVSHLPSGSECSSSGWGPSMTFNAPQMVRDVEPLVGSSRGKAGDSFGHTGGRSDAFGKAPQQKKVVFVDSNPTEQVVH